MGELVLAVIVIAVLTFGLWVWIKAYNGAFDIETYSTEDSPPAGTPPKPQFPTELEVLIAIEHRLNSIDRKLLGFVVLAIITILFGVKIYG